MCILEKKNLVFIAYFYIYIYIKIQFLINQILNDKIKNNIQLEK